MNLCIVCNQPRPDGAAVSPVLEDITRQASRHRLDFELAFYDIRYMTFACLFMLDSLTEEELDIDVINKACFSLHLLLSKIEEAHKVVLEDELTFMGNFIDFFKQKTPQKRGALKREQSKAPSKEATSND